MKALTISQPFASQITSGEKWIENRTWETLYRGPLAIHAGKGTQYLSRSRLKDYPTGAIMAVAQLVACVHVSVIRERASDAKNRHRVMPGTSRYWSEVDRHKHCEGPFCWILEDVRRVGLFVVSGAQGIWNVDFGGDELPRSDA